VMKGGTIYKQ